MKIMKKFKICMFQKTALCLAIEKKNIEIIKYLLSNKRIDVNIRNIFFGIQYNY